MGWERELFEVLDDLEGQARAAFEGERDAELADRARSEYAHVSAASRLMASRGRQVALTLTALGRVEGVLQRVGTGWCAVAGVGQEWVVNTEHVVLAEGLSERSVPEVAWRATSRLPLRSALRGLASSGEAGLVHHVAGTLLDARISRVGQDFVDVVTARRVTVLVPLSALVSVQLRAARD